MKKINLGIIGCGGIAFFTALIGKLDARIRLVACCDVRSEQLKQFSSRFGIRQSYTDYRELLASPDVDAVYLSVPHYLHYEMILAAVAAGKVVLTEKPLTRTLAEGKALIGQLGDAKVGVNYQYRYDRSAHALARAMQAGKLGKVHSVRINIPWHRTEEYFANAPWHRTIARAGGGTLITQGSHLLDLALWALDDAPVSAMAYITNVGFDVEVDTLTHGVVETSGGTLISITSSMVAATEQPVSMEVYGENGTGIYRKGAFSSLRYKGIRLRREGLPVRGVHAMHRSLDAYARWILDGEAYLTPASEAVPVLAAMDGIYRSAKSGIRESIER
jgi:UDP-N-acetyl-2-amino-2-deoxyglucuronate dehydrogenase